MRPGGTARPAPPPAPSPRRAPPARSSETRPCSGRPPPTPPGPAPRGPPAAGPGRRRRCCGRPPAGPAPGPCRARARARCHAPPALAGARILQLLGDGDAVPGRDQARQMPLHSLHRHARQGHALPLAHGLAGQGDAERLADQPGVLVEGLVEVAQAEEEDRVWAARLEIQVLAADGRAQGGRLPTRRRPAGGGDLHGSVYPSRPAPPPASEASRRARVGTGPA